MRSTIQQLLVRWATYVRYNTTAVVLPAHGEWRLPDDKRMCKLRALPGTSVKQTTFSIVPASGLLEFITKNILGPHSQTKKNRNVSVMVMTDVYSKKAGAIDTWLQTATHVENVLQDHSVISFGMPNYLLGRNGPHFCEYVLCIIMCNSWTKHPTRTASYLLTNGQRERWNKNDSPALTTIRSRTLKQLANIRSAPNVRVQNTISSLHRFVPVQFRTMSTSGGRDNIDIPSAIPLDLPRNVSPGLLQNRVSAKFALMRRTAHNRMAVMQRRYKYDDDKYVRQRLVFMTSELVFVDRTVLVVGTKNSKATDKPT